MDYFENLLLLLLERQGLWVKQSFKVDLTKEEKRDIGKPSMPRPEIDLITLNMKDNEITLIEVKSYLNSSGVRPEQLAENSDIPEGRYKLITSRNYREIVSKRLKKQLILRGSANEQTKISFRFACGKVHLNQVKELKKALQSQGWSLWSPEEIKKEFENLSATAYENDPYIISSKVLRNIRNGDGNK